MTVKLRLAILVLVGVRVGEERVSGGEKSTNEMRIATETVARLTLSRIGHWILVLPFRSSPSHFTWSQCACVYRELPYDEPRREDKCPVNPPGSFCRNQTEEDMYPKSN